MAITRLGRFLTVAAVVTAASVEAQIADDPITKIREADVRADLFALPVMRCAVARRGTLDEMDAPVWIAERAREAGLLPAGDNERFEPHAVAR